MKRVLLLAAVIVTPVSAYEAKPPAIQNIEKPVVLTPGQQTLFHQQNLHRLNHCVPAFTWGLQIQADAQAFVNKCNFAHDTADLRNKGEGENLFWSYGIAGAARAAADGWYNEIRYYNFSNPVWTSQNGHFTQMVWKGSLRVGCAKALCNKTGHQWTFWSCRYKPPGNVNVTNQANLRANVLPPKPACTGP